MTKLTRTDRKMLSELQRDGGLSNVMLAERAGMSPSPYLRRVKHLESERYIRRTVALLEQRRLGLGITACVEVKVPQVKGETIVEHFDEAGLQLGRRQ